MSADVSTVVLTGPAMEPLVRAAAALEAEDIPPFAPGGDMRRLTDSFGISVNAATRCTRTVDHLGLIEKTGSPTGYGARRARERNGCA